ncbi:hypothetical protein HYR69_09220 [Candidatus Sumerlaeota bacterium]|nr:hypothetical protein [Candidatus Sumerlaeota bacterium]
MKANRLEIRPEEINNRAQAVLFVEGMGLGSLDPWVLRELFENEIRVEPLGSSFHIRSAAEALHPHHPEYYFLIDRDHHSDEFVETCWRNFPDPKTHNLLVWRRRELENYFLIPEYLAQSPYLVRSEDKLRNWILKECQSRLYFDAANLVIIRLREELKENWIQCFEKPAKTWTRQEALRKLTARPEFSIQARKTAGILVPKSIADRFEETTAALTGGGDGALEFGKGTWLELLSGKAILPTIVNALFKVVDASGRSLQGRQRLNEVAKSLIRLPREQHPEDFRQLHNLIMGRLKTL